jgi:hypothetical protein
MKLIITESKHKSVVFKYFDKFGGEVDNQFINMFKLDDRTGMVSYDDAYKYLIEWRGEEESKELAKTLLLQNPHHIDEYGGYDFFFEVDDIDYWELDEKKPNVVVSVKVNDLSGTVTVSNGENRTLEDALNDDDYGWEIDSEVNWGINDYFKDKITSKTGIKVIFFRPEYSSRIFNFN